MNLRISSWAIRNPIPVIVLFLALLIAGVAGYRSLPVKLYPDVSFAIVQVSVTLSGAAASEVETQITRAVEAAVSNVAGVKHLRSAVSQGLSTTTVEFEIGIDPQKATDEVRAAIDRIRSNLPRGIEQPIVQRFDVDSAPIVTYAVATDTMSDVELSWFVDDTIARRLITVSGVAQIRRVGGVDREINVTLDPGRMDALGLSAPQINNALRAASTDVPGGRSELGGREQTVRVLGAAETTRALGDMVVSTGIGREVRLSEVATVASGAAERRGYAELNGRPVVGFQVMKTPAASDVAVARAIAQMTEQLAKNYAGVTFKRIVSTATSTQNSYTATLEALIEGMALAALVVLLFLRNWRATVITAIAMPISLIPTFAVMSYMGFSLNMITLLALTLVIGILVDDAIVEIENIQKRVELGESPYEAALVGADEIGLAVVATTLTIVVVFLPVSMMGGFAGQFFKEFGFTVAISVLFSLLVARLLTPLLAAYFLKPSSNPHERKPFQGFYRKALDFALAHRWLSIGAGGALFIGSILLVALLPTGFTPPQDSGIVGLSIEGAPGATLADMRRSTQLLTRKLTALPDVETVFTSVGSGGSYGDLSSGTVTVLLKKERSQTTQAFQAGLNSLLLSVPDVRLGFSATGEGGSTTVQVILAGENADQLAEAALTLERQMRSLTQLSNVHQVTPRPGSELIITPKPAEAARLGVNSDALGSIARVATLGDIDANTAKFNSGEQRLPIRVRLSGDARANLETLHNLKVPTSSGTSVPLSAVAEIRFQPGASKIDRFDRKRRAMIEGQLNGASLGEANEAIQKLQIMKNLPASVTQPAYGQSENMNELFGNFGAAILAGVGLIFGVLILLFKSFFKPVTILAALPLSLAGAFLGLLIARSELDLSALIGLLMLMGLAAKNSILLVDFVIEEERKGVSQKDALIRACRERSRPIVMTTVAMAAGMLPTALALGEGSEFRSPMAIAVIGGLISSTVLSLVLVPVVYELVDDFEMWIKPRLAKFVVARKKTGVDIKNEEERKTRAAIIVSTPDTNATL
ncbi:HAE1 family hydrophobic/amphiphilic exporter-1 [Candidatus Nitrotoga sp. BS]|uniref:efflux RND transporter permease subunit n=1 Tax=Candidatus Nitrotoga sp. BS TaxID=2890408 RepID=UPI001EF34D48|nr:efflux RND transporter permease subunit [Candidatus Nitrotoga sp. BS]CAH1194500.1 HAE1 family hydrophobic/amphiphilic exporter-1 [Candidatus Nitrotoga sp. BS]